MAGLGRPGLGPRAAMPAWKRELLERRRAKLAALGAGLGPGTPPGGPAEPLVLAESLGPLRDNPFLRLESERRRGARPLLELFCRVPGVRTIRADNVLIIEADPGFPAAPPAGLRAAEVVVVEAPPPGRVSRLLEKFDPPAAPRPRGSPERARPAPPSPRPALPPPRPGAPPARPAPPAHGQPGAPPARPAPRAHGQPGAPPAPRRSDFLQKTGSNSFTVHPRGLRRGAAARPLPNGPPASEPLAGPANGLAGSSPASGPRKPKVESGEPSLHPPRSPGTPSATPAAPPACSATSPASATPATSPRPRVSAATSANDSFEIRPAPKPDVETLPSGDLQARALASLRLNSRNSFVVIPRRKAPEGSPPQARPSVELPKGQGARADPSPELAAPLVSGGAGVPALPRSPGDAGVCPRLAPARRQRPSSPPPFPPPTTAAQPSRALGVPSLAKDGPELARPGLPVTFIDEVDSEEEAPGEAKLPCPGAGGPPARRHPRLLSELQYQGSNTFTVVPRRTGAPQEPHLGPAIGEPQSREAEAEESAGLSRPQAASGTPLKKRYPTVHEIEVIGGYLALQKSCLTKAGSSRKKMKISFNDKSLQTTFEYPSESSLVQEEEGGAEEEEEGEEEEEAGSEQPFALFLPRATFVSSVGPESPRLLDGSSGLSSYTPKHSLAFSKWQEQALVQAPGEAELPPEEITLTPASQNLSDFRSEPALYF